MNKDATVKEGKGLQAQRQDGASRFTHISVTARQLSESAQRAEAWNDMSYDELHTLEEKVSFSMMGSFVGVTSMNLPASGDPELVARAQQATAFAQKTPGIENPFDGLSRDQLAYVMYDGSGSFTNDEKYSAFLESYRQEQEWRERVVSQAMAEYATTGGMDNFFRSVIDHYQELPAIEQVKYPADYVANLELKMGNIGTDFSEIRFRQIVGGEY